MSYRRGYHPEEFRFEQIDRDIRDKAVYHPELRKCFGLKYERDMAEAKRRYSHLAEEDPKVKKRSR